jgi:hypothetical protein
LKHRALKELLLILLYYQKYCKFARPKSFTVKELTLNFYFSKPMKRFIPFAIVLFIPFFLKAQEEKKFGVIFSGYVKSDLLWDSRQVESLREGHFLLYPLNEKLDKDGKDINAQPSWNLLNIQTRLRVDMFGPDVLGAKVTGAIEGEFFGNIQTDINGFRLRHAYIKLNWKTTELMVGQFWHPMFITACYPEVVSFNTGAPFTPFTRNPQIRLSQNIKNFRIILTALSQVDFKSDGPLSPTPGAGPYAEANTKYLRNSGIPAFNINLEYSKTNAEKGTSFLAGIGADYKTLVPRLSTDSNYRANEKVGSYSAIAYVKVGLKPVTIKLFGVYGQDMYDYTMITGNAVESIDLTNDHREYTPLAAWSVWTEISTTGKKMQGGLFLAYSKNLGSQDELVGGSKYIYARGADMAYLYRISPRFIYNVGKLRIAPEIEYTVVAYGTTGAKGIVKDTKEIGNFRFLAGFYYFF